MNEVIEAIRALMKTKLGGKYKKYYYGEIRVPNQSMLPFLEVVPMSSRVGNRGTGGMMDNEYRVQINIKSTLKKYLKSNTSVDSLEHIQDLVQRIEARDTNGNLKSDTVLGVLHDNLQLSSTANINGEWDISYGEMDLGDSYITMATLLFSVKVLTT